MFNDIPGRPVPKFPKAGLQAWAASVGYLQHLLLDGTLSGHWGLWSTLFTPSQYHHAWLTSVLFLISREGCTCSSCWTTMSAVAPPCSYFPSASQSALAGCTVSEFKQNCFVPVNNVIKADYADYPVPEGSERFYKNITDMIGYRPNPFIKYCWTYITPFICFVRILSEISLSIKRLLHCLPLLACC